MTHLSIITNHKQNNFITAYKLFINGALLEGST